MLNAPLPGSPGMPQLPKLLPGSQGLGGGLTDPQAPSGPPSIPLDSQSSTPSPPPMFPDSTSINKQQDMDGIFSMLSRIRLGEELARKMQKLPPDIAKLVGIEGASTPQGANANMGLPPEAGAARSTPPGPVASAPPGNMDGLARGMRMAANTSPGLGNA